ncbi:MAG TPA: WD40 repeat domain-containing protein, partial [Pyrinomonadaceae bacterium]|nr:WD40 repeat domain-containing protein [Pyrinomonadaceae bacterium]
EVGSWKKIREFEWANSYGNLLFIPDKGLMMDNSGRQWDLNTGQMIKDTNLSWVGNWAALSPDHKRWASVDTSGDVKLVDLEQQKLVSVRHAHFDHGRSVEFSPDGKWLATGAERVVLWDLANDAKVAPLEYESIVWSVAFSPDGRWLVTTHGDGAILVWDVLQRERVANLREHSGGVRAVAFSPDGQRVASASEDQSVIVWDTSQNQKQTVLLGHHSRVSAVAFSKDNRWLASADQDGVVIRWNLEQRMPQLTINPGKGANSYCVAISPDGKWIATTHGVYDSSNGSRVLDLVGDHGAVYGIAFTGKGEKLICVTDHNSIRVFDTRGWRIIDEQRWADRPLIAISVSNDGKYLVTGDDDAVVRLGTIDPLRQVAVLGNHAARIKSVAFSPDGATVASAGDDKTISLWDVSTRSLITHVGTHTSPVYSIAFSPDGARLVSGEHDRSVRLYTRHRTLWGFRLG